MTETVSPKTSKRPKPQVKDNVIKIRLSTEESEAIKKSIPKGHWSKIARSSLLKIAAGGVVNVSEKTERRQIITALARIGANVNQMAKALHLAKRGTPIDRVQLAIELCGIREILISIKESIE